MSNSPNIIFKCKYDLALNHRDNKFRDKDYSKERKKDVTDMIDYYSNPKESAVNMIDYYRGLLSGKKYNLVLEDGSYATKDDINKLKKNYIKYIENSNLWKGIVSFNNPYIYENIDLKTLEQKFAKEIMPQFLKYCGFQNVKNMSYVFAIHTKSKSKHIHIHLAFIEKKPNYRYSKNKRNYRIIGNINEDEKNYLKRLIALTIEKEKYYTPLLIQTNKDIDELKKYFKPNEKNFILNDYNEISIEEKIIKLGSLLKEYRDLNNNTASRVKYNSIKNSKLGQEIKSLTRDIKKYYFQNKESTLYDTKKNIDDDLNKINLYFNNINNDLHIKEQLGDIDIVKKKNECVDNYIYNVIVNHALYKYNKIYNTVKSQKKYNKITIDDLIQEIVYQESSKNDVISNRQRRKKVLINYFSGSNLETKLPSKYKVESALRKVNYEMEQASQKFSELFDYSNTHIN